jgi:type IV secretory pathway VirJ component
VVLISLLAFEHKADWEITVTGWLTDRPSEDATPNGPAVDKIEPKKLQCFYGEDEAESACPDLAPRGAEVIRTGGGHHFGGDYAALAKDILDALHERAHSLPSPT